MVYELLTYYKKNCSTYQLVFKEVKYRYFCLSYCPIIGIILIFATPIFTGRVTTIYYILAVCLVVFGILYYSVNHEAKRIVKDKYLIKIPKWKMWNTIDVHNKINNDRKKLILDFLIKRHIPIKENVLTNLSKSLYKESEKIKFKFPIVPSIFAALFVSVWNNFISWIYKNINDFNTAIQIFCVASLLLIIVAFMIIAIKSMIDDIFEFIFNNDSRNMLLVAQIIDDIIYDLQRTNTSELVISN